MKARTKGILDDLLERYQPLKICKADIEEALRILTGCYACGGKVLVCGNGGSASDSEHIVGELMKGFILKRRIPDGYVKRIKALFQEDWKYLSEGLQGALPAISLVSQSAISTAYINDVSADMVFAQQVYGYAHEGDILVGISTSGNAKNVANAIKIAKAMRIKAIGLTGE